MPVEGYIVNFRLGGNRQYPREVIVEVPGIGDVKSASKLLHRKVVWRSQSGLEFRGVVNSPHGKKGRVIVRFRRPLPGQALGTTVTIL